VTEKIEISAPPRASQTPRTSLRPPLKRFFAYIEDERKEEPVLNDGAYYCM